MDWQLLEFMLELYLSVFLFLTVWPKKYRLTMLLTLDWLFFLMITAIGLILLFVALCIMPISEYMAFLVTVPNFSLANLFADWIMTGLLLTVTAYYLRSEITRTRKFISPSMVRLYSEYEIEV